MLPEEYFGAICATNTVTEIAWWVSRPPFLPFIWPYILLQFTEAKYFSLCGSGPFSSSFVPISSFCQLLLLRLLVPGNLNFYAKSLHFLNILSYFYRHSSKNYGLVMTGQAAAAPVIAVITEFLSPAIGFLGMFVFIAGASFLCCLLNLKFPQKPSPKAVLERLQRAPPSHL